MCVTCREFGTRFLQLSSETSNKEHDTSASLAQCYYISDRAFMACHLSVAFLSSARPCNTLPLDASRPSLDTATNMSLRQKKESHLSLKEATHPSPKCSKSHASHWPMASSSGKAALMVRVQLRRSGGGPLASQRKVKPPSLVYFRSEQPDG